MLCAMCEVILLLALIAARCTAQRHANAVYEERIAAEQMAAWEAQRAAMAVPEPTPEPDPVADEAEWAARVLYGTARNNTREQQEAVVWCIINRMESALYPNSIEAVCKQEGQWMGYSDTSPVMEDLYQIAYDVLSDWHNDCHRVVPPEMLWLSWDERQITLRDDFSEKPGTKYWRA